MSGAIYLIGSVILNLRFMQYAWRLKLADEKTDLAMKTFKFSIVHLMTLFLLLLVDHYLKVSPFYVS